MIVCGWCHGETEPGRCSLCGRDPAQPWAQRNQEPPTAEEWRTAAARREIEQARRVLGPTATLEQIAEHLGVSERTVRRKLSGE